MELQRGENEMIEKTCKTCAWLNAENKMWCNNCERNSFIQQYPFADNFDFWQERKDVKIEEIHIQ